MRIYGLTDTGIVRRINQDAFVYGAVGDKISWAVVCDGMGGVNGGDYASRTAVDVIKSEMDQKLHNDADCKIAEKVIRESIEEANRKVYEASLTDDSLAGMGTTVVAAVVIGDELVLAHSGDSRAYIISPDGITRATNDHSLVQEMVDSGEITEEEARVHPRRNVITRALGVFNSIEIDFSSRRLNENEAILLCSDGLTNFIEDEKILELFCETEEQELPGILVDKANENGGGDNITAVIMYQAHKKED